MKTKKLLLSVFSVSSLLLAGCADSIGDDPATDEASDPAIEEIMEEEEMDDEMVHDESGELPEGLEEADDPMYEVGEAIVIQTDHMEGMNGAEGVVVGAFDTIAYEISYDPTNGEEREENHQWVIHEEIDNAGADAFEPGDEVVLIANHMEGMEGALATIDAAENTTVYMIDYEPTTGGGTVKNHKWVTNAELSKLEE